MRMSKSKVKVMLITFSDVRRIVHKEFLPQGGTIKGIRFNDVEDIKKRDKGAPRHPREIFPGMYGSMAEEDGKMC